MWPLTRNICLSGTGYKVLGNVAFDTTEHLLVCRPGSYAFLGINFIFIVIFNKGYWAMVNVAFTTTEHLPVYRLQARVICLVGIHFLYRVLGTG